MLTNMHDFVSVTRDERSKPDALASLLDTVRTNPKTIFAESTSKVQCQANVPSMKSFSNRKSSTTIR